MQGKFIVDQMKNGLTCLIIFQLVITYGDVVIDKKQLPKEIVKIVYNMLNGDYTYLTEEAQRILSVRPR